MEIKTIEQAKKYLGKIVYTAHNFDAKRSSAKNKVASLYIGGVQLFYNQVNYDVTAFELYEDEKCINNWGDVKLNNIYNTFDNVKDRYSSYFFSKTEAEKFCEWSNKDEKGRDKKRDIATAKELLKGQGVKFEIFD